MKLSFVLLDIVIISLLLFILNVVDFLEMSFQLTISMQVFSIVALLLIWGFTWFRKRLTTERNIRQFFLVYNIGLLGFAIIFASLISSFFSGDKIDRMVFLIFSNAMIPFLFDYKIIFLEIKKLRKSFKKDA